MDNINSVQDIVFSQGLTFYDAEYNERVHHENYVTYGQFNGLVYTSNFSIHDASYKKYYPGVYQC